MYICIKKFHFKGLNNYLKNSTNKFLQLLKNDSLYSKNYLKELFPKNFDTFYLYILNISSTITIPCHILLIYIAITQTPHEIKNYKYQIKFFNILNFQT